MGKLREIFIAADRHLEFLHKRDFVDTESLTEFCEIVEKEGYPLVNGGFGVTSIESWREVRVELLSKIPDKPNSFVRYIEVTDVLPYWMLEHEEVREDIATINLALAVGMLDLVEKEVPSVEIILSGPHHIADKEEIESIKGGAPKANQRMNALRKKVFDQIENPNEATL